ncbi:hypothetical protein [Saccharolobus shibatae]|uniref:hypothetical protein n=1 Tax=Saccharolobus shibatae TaxID=2286 RepID=UPI001C45D40B|nr:hypothetical protein [Saccharolobus shibatae]
MEAKSVEETSERLKDYILAIIKAGNEANSNVDLTKIQLVLFLLQREFNTNVGTDFEIGILGPYSKKAEYVLDDLVNKGVVEVQEFPIRPKGKELQGFIKIRGSKGTIHLHLKRRSFSSPLNPYLYN